tara:strand:- start:1801 stop:3132 length:1332 start_codon:yes stop_codon:yes gene_type:complete
MADYWLSTYGSFGDKDDYGYGIAHDSLNSLYIAGSTRNLGILGASKDATTWKYDRYGQFQSAVTISNTQANSNTDQFSSVAVDSSDNVYSVGHIKPASAEEIYIKKVNASGVIQWQKLINTLGFGGLLGEAGSAIDSSGNIIIAATASFSGTYNIYVVKLNSSGVIQWQKNFHPTYPGDTNSNDGARCVAVDSSDNIFVGGFASGSPDPLFVMKLNSSGTSQWQRCLNTDRAGSTNDGEAYDISVDSSGNVLVCGKYSYYTSILWKLNNSNGLIQWGRQLYTSGKDSAFNGVATDSSDNVYVVGYSDGTTVEGGKEAMLAKYNSAGSLLWQRSFNTNPSSLTPNTEFYAIALDSNQDMIITGSARPDDFNSYNFQQDMIVVKLPNDGSLTGTYGIYTYEASSHTSYTASEEQIAATESNSTATLTASTASETLLQEYLRTTVE